MLSRWLQRGGLGQILAPDPTFKEEEEVAEKTEFTGGIWSVIAPDPNFVSPQKTSEGEGGEDKYEGEGEGVRANEEEGTRKTSMTMVGFETPEKKAASWTTTTDANGYLTPRTVPIAASRRADPHVERMVLTAAKDLTASLLSPQNVWDDVNRFFTYCASTSTLNEKKVKKVKKMLRKDPSLATARASNMGNLVSNGFTPLHAAASAGNIEVAKILIEFEIVEENQNQNQNQNQNLKGDNEALKTNNSDSDESNSSGIKINKHHPVQLDARDVLGRTALHIASEQGQLPLVRLLKDAMTQRNSGIEPLGCNAPMDLTGRTPLGWAATSRSAKARSNMPELRNELFSPGDASVYGKHTPAVVRTGGKSRKWMNAHEGLGAGINKMDLQFGFADMPGHRIEMEDAICHCYPLDPPKKVESGVVSVAKVDHMDERLGFFGVYDGHGDGGISSKFVAEGIVQYLTRSETWKAGVDSATDTNTCISESLTKACSTIDEDLKSKLAEGNSVRNGGSTGVMAVITKDCIITGNVGDSRCILVQKSEELSVEKEKEKESVKINTISKETEAEEDDDTDILEELKKLEVSSKNQSQPKPPQSNLDGNDESDVNPNSNENEKEKGNEQISNSITGTTSNPAKDNKEFCVKALSTDHKPNLPEETARIEKAGMKVIEETFTVNGETTTYSKIQNQSSKIAVSRAFGDFDFKAKESLNASEQAIICTPEITFHARQHSRDAYLILACDGVYDVMSNEEVGEFVWQKVKELRQLAAIDRDAVKADCVLAEVGDELLKECLNLGSTDNMSVLIVALPTLLSTTPSNIVSDDTTRILNFADV